MPETLTEHVDSTGHERFIGEPLTGDTLTCACCGEVVQLDTQPSIALALLD